MQGSPLSAWTGSITEKDWPKRSSDRQLQEAQKKADRVITPEAEAVGVPAHQGQVLGTITLGPCKPSSCATFTFNSHWGRAATGKKEKKSCAYTHRVASVMSSSLWPCRLWLARLLCQQSSSDKNTGALLANTGCRTLLEHWRRKWQPTPVLLPGKSHGQRSL